MSIRHISFAIGEFFHIYNRGNSKQTIFFDDQDYRRFIDLLYAVNRKEKFNFSDSLKGVSVYELETDTPLVAIGAYCLMPNHFHLLITPIEENGMSLFMQKLSTAYVMYFNQKYNRTGSLFEGKFKAVHADSDRYLKYLFAYCHLNPLSLLKRKFSEQFSLKKKDIEYLDLYIYSSFLEYKGVNRIYNKILTTKAFPAYFPTKNAFLKDLEIWISYRNS